VTTTGGAVGGLVDHLFRHSAGRMVAVLARRLGAERLDLAEEVVQDALVRALETWPYRGVPDNPRGWLFQVARHRAFDVLRRRGVWHAKLEALAVEWPEAPAGADGGGVNDDELAMILMCCHPGLPRPARVALTLKTVGGFSVDEIAAALLARPTSVAQRLVRAKRRLRTERIGLGIPPADALPQRLDSVLDVLYLLFNEGYTAHGGENLVRAELCGEAIRLALIVVAHPPTDLPPVRALVALMLLQSSRLPARADEAGELRLLADQDRARWDQRAIAAGLSHLERAAEGDTVTVYHLEAAIAACHAVSPDEASTDWPYVLQLYDDLLTLKPSPVVALNRAIALAMVEGPAAGIRALEVLAHHRALARYYLWPAALAALWRRAGSPATAARYYRAALALPCSIPERRFLERRLAECEQDGAAGITARALPRSPRAKTPRPDPAPGRRAVCASPGTPHRSATPPRRRGSPSTRRSRAG
jgi:RNA polymerase sigma-70 factor (ECF subfamily)